MKHALVRKGNYPPCILIEHKITEELNVIAKGTIMEMLDLYDKWYEECTIEEPTDQDYKILTILEDKAKEFKKALQNEL